MTKAQIERLKDALRGVCYVPGDTAMFKHINYCRWCHYAEGYPHANNCVMQLVDPSRRERRPQLHSHKEKSMDANKMARNFVGIVLMVAGCALAVYAGLWWAFIGGIIQVVEALKATPIEAMDLALGIARIVFAGFIGTITAVVAVFPGFAMCIRP